MSRRTRRRITRWTARADVDRLRGVLARTDLRRGRGDVVVDLAVDDRLAVVDALDGAPDELAIGLLVEALDDPATHVRAAAIIALGDRDATAAVLGLLDVALREDEHPEVAALAGERLMPRAGRLAPADLVRRLQGADCRLPDPARDLALVAAVAESDTAARDLLDQLVALLDHADVEVRARARETISLLGTRAVDPLVAALRRPDVAPEAAALLGRLDTDAAADALTAHLFDGPDPQVRAACAAALAAQGDPAAVEPLLTATDDVERVVRVAAARALDGLGAVALIRGAAHVTSPLLDPTATAVTEG